MMRQTRNRLPPSLPTRPLINVHVYDTHLSSVYDHKSEEKISRADKNQLFTDLNTKLSGPDQVVGRHYFKRHEKRR